MPEKPDKKKADRILAEVRRRQADAKVVEVDEEKIKLVIFSLGDDRYAFYGSDVKKILPYKEITYVPGSLAFISGIINVSGDIESVLNIHKFLNLAETQTTINTRIILAAKAGICSGILVDSVEEVSDIPKSSIKPPISTIDEKIKHYIVGEAIYNKTHVTVFDIGEIFKKIAE